MSLQSKQLNTRIKLKYDSFENWKSNNPKLLKGEVALVTVTTAGTYKNPVTGINEPVVELLMKVGDDESSFNALPWLSAKASDVYSWAKETQAEFETRISGLIASALNGDGTATIKGYVTETDFNAFKAELETWKSAITNSEETGRLDVAEKDIVALKGNKDTDDKDSASVVGAKKYADFKEAGLLGEATDNVSYAAGTEGASLDKQTIKGAINIADAALIKAKSNATNISAIQTAISKLDETYATDAELKSAKDALEGQISGKVAQSAYDTKVQALEKADTDLAARVTPLETDVSALKTASTTHATKTELEQAEARLKGTKASGDTTAETIRGAKDYADQKLAEFTAAYITEDGGTIDKLQDIAKWIADDQAGAAKLAADVSNLQTDKLDKTEFNTFKTGDFKDVADQAHTHSNKALLDTYTQTETDLADAVKKKHAHASDMVEVTPAMKQAWDEVSNKASQGDLNAHTTNKSNPHGVTATQVGAYTTGEADDKFATLTGLANGTTVAKEATHAVNADTAIDATNATKATQDAAGNVIADTYETKSNVNNLATRVKALEDIEFIIIDCGSSVITSN